MTSEVFLLIVQFFVLLSVAISTVINAIVLVLVFRVLRQLDLLIERHSQDALAMFGLEEAVKDVRQMLGTLFDSKFGR